MIDQGAMSLYLVGRKRKNLEENIKIVDASTKVSRAVECKVEKQFTKQTLEE